MDIGKSSLEVIEWLVPWLGADLPSPQSVQRDCGPGQLLAAHHQRAGYSWQYGSILSDTCSLQGRKETYQSARTYAAQYMRTHPDEFLAFLETEDDGLMSPGAPFSHSLPRL